MTTTMTTYTPCPTWCTVAHDEAGAFHAGPRLSGDDWGLGRLWQQDDPEARPGVVIAGKLLSEAQAHELGMALVRAADLLRRSRTEAHR